MDTTTTSATVDGRGRSITTFVVYEATQRLNELTEGQVAKEQLVFDDLPLVEYLTFMRVMEQADIQLYL